MRKRIASMNIGDRNIFLMFCITCLVACVSACTAGVSGQGEGKPDQPTEVIDASIVSANLPDIASVVEQALPSVVSVMTTIERPSLFGGDPVEGTTSSSGVIFNEQGNILTNNHVVEGATRVTVVLYDGSQHEASILGRDPSTDLAVLRLDTKEGLELAASPLGDTDAMRIGDWVIAIGNPLGFAGSVTVGIVSAKGRLLRLDEDTLLEDLVQTDAVINPGNSGGPLLNLRGEVVGINTAIIRGSLGGGQEAEGIGFAISMNTAIPVAEQLITNGRVIWPWLGVFVEAVTPVKAAEEGLSIDRGVLIVATVEGAPAQSAGVEAGDVIVALDDQPVNDMNDLRRILRIDYSVGDLTEVTVVRGPVRLAFSVELGELPR